MTEPGTTGDDVQTRPFAAFLQDQSSGKSHRELSRLLQELTAAVVQYGKTGKITYTVTVAPLKGGAPGTLTVEDAITSKIPAANRQTSIFFADKDNNLVRQDPRQERLPFLEPVPDDASARIITEAREARP